MRHARHILLVDADTELARLLAFVLDDLGELTVAHSFQEAELAIRAQPPDVLVTSFALPDASGLAIMHLARSQQKIAVPVLLIDAKPVPGNSARAFDGGADEYLAQPLDVDELKVRLRALLRLRSDAVELADRNEQLEQANWRANTLLRSSEAVNGLGEQVSVLQSALGVLPVLFAADRVSVWLEHDLPSGQDDWGMEAVPNGHPRPITRSRGQAFAALSHEVGRDLAMIDDPATFIGLDLASELGCTHFITSRIQRRETHIGSLFIGFLRRPEFRPGTEEVVRGVSNQLAIAIENARLYEQLHAAALTDSTTGFHNMRYFRMTLETELLRSKRLGQPLSVLMMDLDNFKNYNDMFGHQAGDEALRQFGNFVRADLRRYDVFARYGGDEFIALLPATGPVLARTIADRLQLRIGETIATVRDGIEVRLSCSVGSASYPADGTGVDSLVRAADDAHYAVKRLHQAERTA